MSDLGHHSAVLSMAIDITAAMILLGTVCAFVRMIKGPTLPDRVVSVDLITVFAVVIVGLIDLSTDSAPFIDVAFAIALVAFLATVAFAWYADQRTDQDSDPPSLEDEGEGR